MESKKSVIQFVAETRNWLEMPPEVMHTILLKLGAIEILNGAQNVCSSWRKFCKDPLMWRVIDMDNSDDLYEMDRFLETMCRLAIDRSCGQLIDIKIGYFATDELLQYITRSSNQLTSLRLADCEEISNEGLTEAVSRLPLLENLQISAYSFDAETLKTVGRCCPLLKSLKPTEEEWRRRHTVNNMEAFVISETMPKLHELQIIGNGLSNKGLQAILDGCPDLESLDLRQCFHLKLEGQLGKECGERMKILYLPQDPVSDGHESDDEDLTNFSNFDGDYYDLLAASVDHDDFPRNDYSDCDDFTAFDPFDYDDDYGYC